MRVWASLIELDTCGWTWLGWIMVILSLSGSRWKKFWRVWVSNRIFVQVNKPGHSISESEYEWAWLSRILVCSNMYNLYTKKYDWDSLGSFYLFCWLDCNNTQFEFSALCKWLGFIWCHMTVEFLENRRTQQRNCSEPNISSRWLMHPMFQWHVPHVCSIGR